MEGYVIKSWLAKSLFWLICFGTIIFFSSCRSGYVTLNNDDQDLVIEKAGGDLSPERFLAVKYLQENLVSLQTLEEQYRVAVRNKNIARADSLQDLIDRRIYSGATTGSSSGRYQRVNSGPTVNLTIKNNSEQVVELLNGPFAGTVLGPGESTANKRPFQLGIYQMELKIYRIGKSGSSRRKINIHIKKDLQQIALNQ